MAVSLTSILPGIQRDDLGKRHQAEPTDVVCAALEGEVGSGEAGHGDDIAGRYGGRWKALQDIHLIKHLPHHLL
jgi:hypothetical protein